MTANPRPLLEQLLDSRDDTDIMVAARELAPRIDLALLSARLLVDLLDTGSAARAAAAAFILGEWAEHARAASPNLVSALRKNTRHPNVTVRHWCITALMRLGASAAGAVSELADSLRDPDDGVRAISAHALGGLGRLATGAVPKLLIAVFDDAEEVRQAAIAALVRIDPHGNRYVRELASGLGSPSSRARQSAIEALTRMRTAALPAVQALCERMHDENAAVRRKTVYALVCILPPERALLHTLGVAMHDTDEDVRMEALRGFRGFTHAAADAAPYVMGALRDSAPRIRFFALEILERMTPDLGPMIAAVRVAIGHCLHDSSMLVQTRAVQASGRLAQWTHPADPRLLNALFESDGALRLAATRALAQMHNDPAALDALRFRLADERADVRAAACRALVELGERPSAIIPSLLQALGDSDLEIQREALAILEVIGADAYDALDAVAAKRSDSNLDIRNAADRASASILRKPEAV
ncbi:MAG: HEAT repeat domain-containing protein [Candidatus Hydrogenedentes bacterium]|nr:HEAT repeat domain-containing protein [Candidatus Hydrogenedentota bacterium]